MKRKLMKRKYVTLSDLCLKKLNAMGKHTGLSASELIRNSVDVYWEKLVKEKLEQVKKKHDEKGQPISGNPAFIQGRGTKRSQKTRL